MALITNRKKPKVNTVTGKVNKMSNGFRVTFNIANTMDTKMAEVNPVNSTPFKSQAVKNTAKALINSFTNTFIL